MDREQDHKRFSRTNLHWTTYFSVYLLSMSDLRHSVLHCSCPRFGISFETIFVFLCVFVVEKVQNIEMIKSGKILRLLLLRTERSVISWLLSLWFISGYFSFLFLSSSVHLSCVSAVRGKKKIKNVVYIVHYTLEILHSQRWMLAAGDWAGPSGDVAGSLVARCSARSQQRHLDSSSRWWLAFANKLLAAAACLLSLCLQKRLGSVDPLC